MTELVSLLFGFLGELGESKRWKESQRDKGLNAIHKACMETRFYLRMIENGHERNMEKQKELAKLWKTAAVFIRHVDKDLSKRCSKKGEYWVCPERWTKREVHRNRIKIEQVAEMAEKLLSS